MLKSNSNKALLCVFYIDGYIAFEYYSVTESSITESSLFTKKRYTFP